MEGSRVGLIATVDFYQATIRSNDKGTHFKQAKLK
jgi:hypothetical protein